MAIDLSNLPDAGVDLSQLPDRGVDLSKLPDEQPTPSKYERFIPQGLTGREEVAMEQQFSQEHPYIYGAAKALTGMIPKSVDELKAMVRLPMPVADVEKNQQESEQWGKAIRGEYGPIEQAATITGTALQALPLAGLPFSKSPLVAKIKTDLSTGVPVNPNEFAPPGKPPLPPELTGIADSGEVPSGPEHQAIAAQSTGNIFERVSGAMRNFRDVFTIEPVPKLGREGGAELKDAAFKHASARNAVTHVVRDRIAQVFPDSYKSPEAMMPTGDILVKDNILGVYDQVVKTLEASDKGSAEANRLAANKIAIEQTHDLASYETDVANAVNDPKIAPNIERWKQFVNPEMDQMYAVLRRADPNAVFEPRGRHFGARINLLPLDRAKELASFTDVETPMPEPTYSNYRNPNVKRDPFNRHATATGRYSTDPNLILMNTFGGRYNEVTKLQFYDAIEKSGAGVMIEPGGDRPPNADQLTRLPVKVPQSSDTGKVQQVEKSLWVKKSIAPEVLNVLNVSGHSAIAGNPVLRALTDLQLLGITDATAHLKNIHTVIANSPMMSSAWGEAVRRMPLLSTADAVGRMVSVSREVFKDTPAIRAEIADLSKQGLIRPKYPSTGLSKITQMQHVIHNADTAARIIMSRAYDNMVERGWDPITTKHEFVSQIGEYNPRVMSRLMRGARDVGASPFIVAGRNFNKFSKRLITGDPGIKFSSNQATLAARTYQMSTLATATALPALVNYFTTGRIAGRKGTPIGAIDTGSNDEKGNQVYYDLFQLLGIRRGLRATGAGALVEGLREGRGANEIGGKMITDITTTAAHPWIGPGAGFLYAALSGKRLDLRGQGEWPFVAKQIPEGGTMQYVENARAALKNNNPLLYSLAAQLFGDPDMTRGEVLKYGFLKAPLSSIGSTALPGGSAFAPFERTAAVKFPSRSGQHRAHLRRIVRNY